MSRVEVAGNKEVLVRLLLDAVSEKMERVSPLVGDAKGLSGRLCSSTELKRREEKKKGGRKIRVINLSFCPFYFL